jgi:hypothetical protein
MGEALFLPSKKRGDKNNIDKKFLLIKKALPWGRVGGNFF